MSKAVMPTGEKVILSSAHNSSGDTYHTRECRMVGRMKAQKVVDLSVAEWKGLEPCKYCSGEFQ